MPSLCATDRCVTSTNTDRCAEGEQVNFGVRWMSWSLHLSILINLVQLRLTFDNQAAISSAIQNFGRLIDVTREQQHSHLSASQVFQLQHHQQQQQQQQQHHSPQQARLSMAQYSHSAMPYVPPSTSPRYTPSSQNDQCKSLAAKSEHMSLMRGIFSRSTSGKSLLLSWTDRNAAVCIAITNDRLSSNTASSVW